MSTLNRGSKDSPRAAGAPTGRKEAGKGRPRDSRLEGRVFDAAIKIYAAGGWAALTFDRVARGAGVGKAALYLRWQSRGELFYEMLKARWFRVSAIDTGTLREDLLALGRVCFDANSEPYGAVGANIRIDSARIKEVRQCARQYSEQLVQEGRRIVRRAIERGELSAHINPGLIMDVVVGGVTNHLMSTPKRLRAAMMARSDQFLCDLVDLVLIGVRAGLRLPLTGGAGSSP
jgi:AcrR family transcriptional regulator